MLGKINLQIIILFRSKNIWNNLNEWGKNGNSVRFRLMYRKWNRVFIKEDKRRRRIKIRLKIWFDIKM
jgi:hypothetical protein